MKVDSVVLLSKAACYLIIGLCAPLGASLAQWANSGESPSRVTWVVIIGACLTGGATQMLSFFSQSYGNWKAGQTNGSPATETKPV